MPLNLSKAGDSVDHIVTGSWSKKAAEEAKKYCKVNVAAKGDNKHIPEQKSWKLQKQAKYVHYCDNETIQVYLQLRLPDGINCTARHHASCRLNFNGLLVEY